ncbi:hypothetical protein PHYBLDRAFT_150288 [Phycomyces blakesleeanus NRRL 1555(-)]|uniref:Uncharacterized protein n=1 Tax=Phycomyces blakesleeanus (strain ATCC 8743b / DSM 1359 / FGSC 10004 / NBRC 33097 / NRRL 1555) TaxID=763407 RepID=A0A167KRE6_PHYB8|nr:hypothetical protein PHYBLDRAFT_150288 [Phycomyces blakesleeanus NRRL 1555(-)]OAD68698.1 hypothetical protein PHYBLDRAFT_150288 [Phycomyces blakesleeanus NRRL 1555(-)]|eukprot:XP_018286738.1 hypothetical protein PHYBLDRAFT_150288 [Phycomyces blakesleeanus NRRL 1555(-)]
MKPPNMLKLVGNYKKAFNEKTICWYLRHKQKQARGIEGCQRCCRSEDTAREEEFPAAYNMAVVRSAATQTSLAYSEEKEKKDEDHPKVEEKLPEFQATYNTEVLGISKQIL